MKEGVGLRCYKKKEGGKGYLFGHVRLLWPSLLQVLHNLLFFGGGRETMLSDVRVPALLVGLGGVRRVDRRVESSSSAAGAGVPARLVDFGTAG